MSHIFKAPLPELEHHNDFIERHIGPSPEQIHTMLSDLGVDSIDELLDQTLPKNIRLTQAIDVGSSHNETESIATLRNIAAKNKVFKSYIGTGYHPTITPSVISRNILENPGWYTAYTPYQPEISQGRLEALLNFQQVSIDLTGLELASASLLDEATAAAEAMALTKRLSKNKKSNLFFIADDVLPQTINVVETRARMFGFETVVAPSEQVSAHNIFGALFQYPSATGEITDLEPLIKIVHEQKGLVAVAADIMSLLLLKSPGDLGADVVFGSSQRFGVPMGYGGPHAAFFVTKDKFKRSLPGRIIGVSKDRDGKSALRMAMQTREQHIRREKATSNICTAQVLLANIASFYAVYHGPSGLKTIANRIHRLTSILALGLQQQGVGLKHNTWFDTITLTVDNPFKIVARAEAAGVNLKIDVAQQLSISLNETTTKADIEQLFTIILGEGHKLSISQLDTQVINDDAQAIPAQLARKDDVLTNPVFNSYHSETELMRYIKRLENKDLALNHSMISLGSCTMKLNAAAEMVPISWPGFADLHPFCPKNQAVGYAELIDQLGHWLAEITGYDEVSFQPNSGAQGEYAGLVAIEKYYASIGEAHRNICLIPSSAHGTNPASAQMAGMRVIVVECDKEGNIDFDDLKAKAEASKENLACLMVTYPSTHGVFEEDIREICELIHEYGGQVYMDGANMNAQVGLTSPGFIGSDVSHLNLHKTFAIPHGGGGPGVGPIGVKKHLAPFLPGHPLVTIDNKLNNNGAVSAAPYGSAGVLPISWSYVYMLGSEGVTYATQIAILNANYMAKKLSEHYPILYSGRNGRIAHECIVDLRPVKESSGISELDIAKRLMDYGFHAPTMSFPVAGTLMIEPTESESKEEIDRFIEALVCIRQEIAKVESGEWTIDDNPLVFAPHTMHDVLGLNWERSYCRHDAAFPVERLENNKFWPSVSRIDDVYGDRNLICSCVPLDVYR